VAFLRADIIEAVRKRICKALATLQQVLRNSRLDGELESGPLRGLIWFKETIRFVWEHLAESFALLRSEYLKLFTWSFGGILRIPELRKVVVSVPSLAEAICVEISSDANNGIATFSSLPKECGNCDADDIWRDKNNFRIQTSVQHSAAAQTHTWRSGMQVWGYCYECMDVNEEEERVLRDLRAAMKDS
jgi:hypothetical protein